MSKRLGELILSGFFIAIGIAAIIIIQLQTTTAVGLTGATTFKTFPTVFGAMVVIFAGINAVKLIIEGMTEKRRANEANEDAEKQELTGEEKKRQRIVALRVTGMFLLTVAFALLLKQIHFALLVFVFLFLSFLLLGRRKIWANTIVSAVGSGVVYLLFAVLLNLPL